MMRLDWLRLFGRERLKMNYPTSFLYSTRLLTILFLLFFAICTCAQEGPVTFEFSFSNPGARSMGLGGAFAALADDATAAYANPAGLVQLLEPELSMEVRHWAYSTPFVAGGRITGPPSGEGIDTVTGIRSSTSNYDQTGLSEMSVVYPYKNWSFALYYHHLADFKHRRTLDGLFAFIDGEDERSEDVVSRTDLRISNWGLATAYRLSDTLSIGLGVVYWQSKLDAFSEEFTVMEAQFYQANPFTYENLDTQYYNNGEDNGFTFQLGLLWRISSMWSIGGYYRQGPRMKVRVVEITGPANDDEEPGTVEVDETSPLSFPNVYGLGAAFTAPNGLLTVSFEWSRVTYSAITDDLNDQVFGPGQVKVNDGDEYHLGVEYIVASADPIIALRCGAWFDPAHGLDSGRGEDVDIFERTIYTGGDDQWHLSGGLGLVFKKFQFDMGVDIADTIDQVSLSAVYRF